jgi:hypothetical protein
MTSFQNYHRHTAFFDCKTIDDYISIFEKKRKELKEVFYRNTLDATQIRSSTRSYDSKSDRRIENPFSIHHKQ